MNFKEVVDLDVKLSIAGRWEEVIRDSHEDLIDPDYLIERGREYAEIASSDPDSIPDWPVIPKDKCRFEQSEELPERCWGFDLPLYFQPDDWNKKTVALIFQDPLRFEKNGKAFTMAAPWLFFYPRVRMKGIARKIWPSIEGLYTRGYGVYVTDASKLFFAPHNGKKSFATRKLELEVLKTEICRLKPERVVAFGKHPEWVLKEANLDVKQSFFPHPNARGHYLKNFYDVGSGKFDVVGQATLQKILSEIEN
ncbi:MAG: hypothetical protein VX248_00030 [Pseudomonadota bacterium]|nr:hypothetical protein [Pseudomonadota bacterium]